MPLRPFDDLELRTKSIPGTPIQKFFCVYDAIADQLAIVTQDSDKFIRGFASAARGRKKGLSRFGRVAFLFIFEPTPGDSDGVPKAGLLSTIVDELITKVISGGVAPLAGGDRCLATVIGERNAIEGRIDVRHWLRHYAQMLHNWIMEAESEKDPRRTIKNLAEKEPPWDELNLPALNPILAEAIKEFHERFNDFRDLIRDDLQKRLDDLFDPERPFPFENAAEKKTFASGLQRLLTRLDLRLTCPDCGMPASLRGGLSGTSKQGVFRFEHFGGGTKTSHAILTHLPKLILLNRSGT